MPKSNTIFHVLIHKIFGERKKNNKIGELEFCVKYRVSNENKIIITRTIEKEIKCFVAMKHFQKCLGISKNDTTEFIMGWITHLFNVSSLNISDNTEWLKCQLQLHCDKKCPTMSIFAVHNIYSCDHWFNKAQIILFLFAVVSFSLDTKSNVLIEKTDSHHWLYQENSGLSHRTLNVIRGSCNERSSPHWQRCWPEAPKF